MHYATGIVTHLLMIDDPDHSLRIWVSLFLVLAAKCVRFKDKPDVLPNHRGVVYMPISDNLLSSGPYLLEATPLLAAGGPFGAPNVIAVLASVAIAIFAWQAWSTRPRFTDHGESRTTQPPANLHPALAGALASGRVSDNQIEATVLEMVRQRSIEIEPDQKQKDKVQIRILDADQPSNEIERELMTLLTERAENGVVSYRVLSRLRNEWGNVRSLLRNQLIENQWLKPSEIQTRLPFVLPGSIGLLTAAIMVPVAISTESGWPLLGGLLVGTVGSITLIMGNIVPHTTDEGERAALPWRGYRTGLIIARDQGHGTIDLDQAFPYIVAMGMAPGFDRYLRRAGQSGYVPEWIGPRPLVLEWSEGWHTYWIALHTALAPTDPTNTPPPPGANWRKSLTGGRF